MFRCANTSCEAYTTRPQTLRDGSKWRTIGSFWPGDWEKPVDGATHTCINCYKQKLRLQREAEEARSSRSKSVPPVEHHKPPLSEVEGLAQNPALSELYHSTDPKAAAATTAATTTVTTATAAAATTAAEAQRQQAEASASVQVVEMEEELNEEETEDEDEDE